MSSKSLRRCGELVLRRTRIALTLDLIGQLIRIEYSLMTTEEKTNITRTFYVVKCSGEEKKFK
jgi:hypothetical protein